MTTLDYIDGDDWTAIYVNGVLEYEGHSIPDHSWLGLLALGAMEVHVWEWDFSELGGRGPRLFSEALPYVRVLDYY